MNTGKNRNRNIGELKSMVKLIIRDEAPTCRTKVFPVCYIKSVLPKGIRSTIKGDTMTTLLAIGGAVDFDMKRHKAFIPKI